MRLFINGQQVDLSDDTVIAQTKQINDLASIQTRNSNYTNSFDVPKTAKNLRTMEFMSLPGSNSTTPYRKNFISLYSDAGECFIKDGWAVISDNGDSYKIAIVDGIIDFYKAIENKTLATIVGEDFNHEKNVANVVILWENIAPYAYIVADYNGNNGDTSAGSIDIDYLVPSVRVSELWFRMFQFNGMQYSGSVFDTFNFQNLWLTFPKAPQYTSVDTDIYVSDDITTFDARGMRPMRFESATTNNLQEVINKLHLQVAEAAKYKIHFTGTLEAYSGSGSATSELPIKVVLFKNVQNTGYTNISGVKYPEFLIVQDNIPFGTDIDVYSEAFTLNEGDTISIVVRDAVNNTTNSDLGFSQVFDDVIEEMTGIETVSIELIKVESNVFDFQTAFADFSLKDFATEIVQRFGLTIFKDPQTGHYNFLTLQEILQDTSVEDWSDKFVELKSEDYAIGSYAQNNYYRYRYNDDGSSFNDSQINVINANLDDTKDLFVSKIHSPERLTTKIFNDNSNVYKMWDKEIKDDSTVDYKPKDNRYYLMRANDVPQEISVYSTGLSESPVTATHYFKESFYKLSFFDILQEYYFNITRILDRVKVDKVTLYIKDTDLINFNFRKLIYIKQLSNYFLVNKIVDYIPGKPTTVELTRVVYSDLAPPLFSISITSSYYTETEATGVVSMPFISNYAYGTLKAQASLGNNTTWIETLEGFVGGICNVATGEYHGLIYLRILDTDNGVVSNEISLTI